MAKHIIYDSCETCEENEYWLDDERTNLNKELPHRIIAIADLDLWNGHKSGYMILGNNLNEVLNFFGCDDITVEFDGKDVVSKAYHHDGTNAITYREIKDNDSIDELTEKIYNGVYSEDDVNKYTTSLGKYVQQIYGW